MQIQLPDTCQRLGIHLCDGDVPVVGSLAVASFVDKAHRHVLRDIEKHLRDIEKAATSPNLGSLPLFEDGFTTGQALTWFRLTAYRDPKGEYRPAYDLMRPAANYVISSYTGENVATYKVALFHAFEIAVKVIDDFKRGQCLPLDPGFGFPFSARTIDLIELPARQIPRTLGDLMAEFGDPVEALHRCVRLFNSPARYTMSPADIVALREMIKCCQTLVRAEAAVGRRGPPVIDMEPGEDELAEPDSNDGQELDSDDAEELDPDDGEELDPDE